METYSRTLHLAGLLVALSLICDLVFMLATSPYTMVLFVFVGQACFVVGAGLYILDVLRDLRRMRVL
ncbi:MAG: hypothetical protein HY710_11190 [Candidatus Latescibacteria bacterium]|nr:hypothetical protein [Candidatus Latescibacterota bacterium]